jgi:F0F1-type ATP synthase assembly protein I
MLKKMRENKSLAKGVLMYISFSVLGPLLTIGAIGYILDNVFGTKPFMLLGSVLVAYVLSNFLVFKKIKEFNASLEKIERESKKESFGQKEENK